MIENQGKPVDCLFAKVTNDLSDEGWVARGQYRQKK